MPLKKSELSFYPRIGLNVWKDKESRTLLFLNNGNDYTGDFGMAYIYDVLYLSEKRSLWVKPQGPLAIGLQPIVNEKEDLKGLTIEITKHLGKTNKETRYVAKIVNKVS